MFTIVSITFGTSGTRALKEYDYMLDSRSVRIPTRGEVIFILESIGARGVSYQRLHVQRTYEAKYLPTRVTNVLRILDNSLSASNHRMSLDLLDRLREPKHKKVKVVTKKKEPPKEEPPMFEKILTKEVILDILKDSMDW